MVTLTAWATLGLLVATCIYAFLTWRLAKYSAASAQHAKEAAEAAVTMSSLALGAAVPDIRGKAVDAGEKPWDPYASLVLTNAGSSVTLSAVEVLGIQRSFGVRKEWAHCPRPVILNPTGGSFPLYVGAGEQFEVQASMPDAEQMVQIGRRHGVPPNVLAIKVRLRYSALPGGPEMTRSATIQTSADS